VSVFDTVDSAIGVESGVRFESVGRGAAFGSFSMNTVGLALVGRGSTVRLIFVEQGTDVGSVFVRRVWFAVVG